MIGLRQPLSISTNDQPTYCRLPSQNMNAITNLTPQQLRHAADIQERILSLQQELDQLLESGSSTDIAPTIKRRRLSAQGIANIRAGVRKRWTETRAGNGVG